jgi:predicted N-acetyltransferase YhbS
MKSNDKMIKIRNEQEADFRVVEEITRKAFWNLYVPGCNEHYLAHIMRSHEDFIPELDLVVEMDGHVVGNIMYTKAKLVDESGQEKDILTFGPVCILPECQRMGLGKALIEHSFERAIELGYDAIVIFGNPGNYVSRGFMCCKKYNVSLDGGTYPSAMMVKELKPNALEGKKWVYRQSPVFEIDEQKVESFDESFEKMEKRYQPCQEEFYIHSHSQIVL